MSEFNCMLVGGTGGLGSQIETSFRDTKYNIIALSSKQCDITDPVSIKNVLNTYKPNIVVNLAAVSIDGLISDYKESDLEKSVGVNVIGSFNLIKETSNYWKDNNIKGKFIYISSVLSQKPVKGAGCYSASKAFNDNLIKVAAQENARYGSTWNSILLGYFEGGLCDKLPDNIKEATLKNIPLRRFGKIDELVSTIKFLSETTYCNGSVLKLDGGLL